MSDYLFRVPLNWPSTLKKVLAAAKSAKKGLVVFDLDSTIFDNRPRQARIVREFGAARGITQLKLCQPWHFTSGWNLDAAVVACGLTPTAAKTYSDALHTFWKERFFTSEYCKDDIEILGAPRYLAALLPMQAKIVYVTGRHEEMRKGTEACLKRCGMPLPDAAAKSADKSAAGTAKVTLIMKPTLEEKDDEFKRKAHEQLAKLGTVIAAFDNEPRHINDYAEKFKKALCVHLATDQSSAPIHPGDRCVSIPHFAY